MNSPFRIDGGGGGDTGLAARDGGGRLDVVAQAAAEAVCGGGQVPGLAQGKQVGPGRQHGVVRPAVHKALRLVRLQHQRAPQEVVHALQVQPKFCQHNHIVCFGPNP